MTSKRQITIPKALADRYGIVPGSQLEWQAAGDVIRVVPPGRRAPTPNVEQKLALFDAATGRQRAREEDRGATAKPPGERGWTRDELYDRGRTKK